MYKTTSDNAHFMRREGSFSTHGSQRGFGLLGHGEPEALSPEQERACLQAVARGMQAQFRDAHLKKHEREQLAREYNEINERINAIRPKARTPGIENYVIDVLRESLPKREFDRLFQEAKKRWQAAGGHA